MKGLLGNPVCMVEDNLERRILWSAPSGEDMVISYRPPGSTRYSANRSKHQAAIGIGMFMCILNNYSVLIVDVLVQEF